MLENCIMAPRSCTDKLIMRVGLMLKIWLVGMVSCDGQMVQVTKAPFSMIKRMVSVRNFIIIVLMRVY